MQERHFRIEQNPIDLRVIHVPRGNLNRRQAAAVTECLPSDTCDAIRDRDARESGAITEGPYTDAGDRIAFNGCRYG